MEVRVDVVAERLGQFKQSRSFTKGHLEEVFEILEHPLHPQRLNPLERLLFALELVRGAERIPGSSATKSFLEEKITQLWNELLSPNSVQTRE
jgi:hypothetical protein